MPDNALISFVTQSGLALSPLRTIDSPQKAQDFFKILGYDLSGAVFGGALPPLATATEDLISAVEELAAASDEELGDALLGLLEAIAFAAQRIKDLADQLSSGGPVIPNIGDFPRRLIDYLLLEYLYQNNQATHEVILLIGLIEDNPEPAAGESIRRINWERIPKYFSEPGTIADAVYSWNTDFDSDKFLERLERVCRALELPGGLYSQSDITRSALGNTTSGLKEMRMPLFQRGLTPATYAQFGVNFSPAEAKAGKKKGLALLPYLMGTASFDFDVCERGELIFESSAEISGAGLIIRPPFDAEGILNITGRFSSSITVQEKTEHANELIIFGSTGGSRLSVQGLGMKWFMKHDDRGTDFGMEGEIRALRVIINGSEGDGFISEVLSGINVEAESSLGFGITLLNGFTFRAAGSLSILIPTHIELGPIGIYGLKLTITPSDEKIRLEVGSTIKVDLGPFQATVEELGIEAGLYFREGNMGSTDLKFDFKPPKGIGLSIDSGVVKGGGYLFIDVDKGEYAGVAELTIQEVVSVKAIAIITTKLPSGEEGYSFLLLITAEFTPIQLGFGFTLLGVGGLIAINRSMNLEAIREGVRTNSISSIMFPDDPVANAPRIIADLNTIFPIAVGYYSFGLMGNIGWGTPTLISVELGLMIQVPDPIRIALLGIIKSLLPTEEAAILKLQVNFAGTLDAEIKLITFDATLFDSRLLTFTLSGDMAFRLSYGDNPNFLISVGGFHPDYQPPANLGLPQLRRLSLNLLGGDNPRLTLATYFAVTSNTVQFGASIDFLFKVSKFKVVGYLGFDALFQFSPFYFKVSIAAGLEVMLGSTTLLGVSVSGSLEGPTPWHIKGKGKFKIFIFSFSVSFDKTFGDRREDLLPDIQALPILKEALAAPANWQAQLPQGQSLLVSLRKTEQEGLVAHPNGSLAVRQNKLPIDLELDKIGNQKISGENVFSLQLFDSGGTAMDAEALKDFFAPAQYRNLKDEDKLSSSSYEKYNAGIKAQITDTPVSDDLLQRDVIYERKILDTRNSPRRITRRQIDAELFATWTNGTAVATSVRGREITRKRLSAGREVHFADTAYAVVSNSDLSIHKELTADSEAAAIALMKTTINADPQQQGKLQVIPLHELG